MVVVFSNTSSQVYLLLVQDGCSLTVALPVSICSATSTSHPE